MTQEILHAVFVRKSLGKQKRCYFFVTNGGSLWDIQIKCVSDHFTIKSGAPTTECFQIRQKCGRDYQIRNCDRCNKVIITNCDSTNASYLLNTPAWASKT